MSANTKGPQSIATGKANAHLIAAALDLLAELKQCAFEMEEAANLMQNFPRASAVLFAKAAERARATVSKVEGALKDSAAEARQ